MRQPASTHRIAEPELTIVTAPGAGVRQVAASYAALAQSAAPPRHNLGRDRHEFG